MEKYNQFRKNIKTDFDKLCEKLIEYGYKAHETGYSLEMSIELYQNYNQKEEKNG